MPVQQTVRNFALHFLNEVSIWKRVRGRNVQPSKMQDTRLQLTTDSLLPTDNQVTVHPTDIVKSLLTVTGLWFSLTSLIGKFTD